jgi:SAM-dependent methyltransferase
LNPRLRPDLIVDSYAEGEDAAFVEQDAMRIRTFTAALRRLSKKYGLALSAETKALDIGCAGGAFLRAARDLELSAIGVEPSKWLSEHARSKHGLDVRTGTLSDHSFPEEYFDLITLWDVIEHLPDAGAELKQIHRLIKPDGLLVVNYPDFGSFIAQMLGKKWPFLLSVHLVYYTPQTIRKQLLKSGFEISDIRMHWQTLELGYILKRMTAYFPFVRFFGYAVEKIGLGSLPVKYWMGRTQVIAKKC